MFLGFVKLPSDAVRRAQQPVGADLIALDGKIGAGEFIRQFQRAGGSGESGFEI